MTSERKIAANRENARRSTGPRTATGKARVRHNAWRHGIARSIRADPIPAMYVNQLARVLTDRSTDPESADAVRIAAEAEIEIIRVRTARAALIQLGVGVGALSAGLAPAPGGQSQLAAD